tara:strand:+ start:13456 stop:14088 length:633 start_codon:yes stop_codon:yes gene_type:complete
MSTERFSWEEYWRGDSADRSPGAEAGSGRTTEAAKVRSKGLGMSQAGFSNLVREFNTVLVLTILGVCAYMLIVRFLPGLTFDRVVDTVPKFAGWSWPFFAVVFAFLFWVLAARIADASGFVTARRWGAIGQVLHWATEACPLMGLLTTFTSLRDGLLVYGQTGPGQPESQTLFIAQFAIAIGSSIVGGIAALKAFTLHRTLPRDETEEGT